MREIPQNQGLTEDSSLPALAVDPAKIEKIVAWIVAGAGERQLKKAIESGWPGEDPGPLIDAAVGRISESGRPDMQTLRGWCIEATRSIYGKAVADKDHDLALRAVNQLHRIASSGGGAGGGT